MNTIIKNILGVVLIFIMLGVIGAITQYVSVYEKSIDPSSFRSFSVSGGGKAVGIPDIARFNFTVLTEGGKNIGALQQENTAKMDGAIAFLKSKGVDEKDIKTQSYDVQPRYQYYNCSNNGACPPAEIVGYTITQTAAVKIRNFSVIGDTLSGVVDKGANSVSGLSFAIDDPTMVQNEARAEAIAKAYAKAQSLAQAGGFTLGRLISIEEGGGYQPTPVYAMDSARYGVGMGGGGPVSSIEAGSQDVSVSVTLRYEIR